VAIVGVLGIIVSGWYFLVRDPTPKLTQQDAKDIATDFLNTLRAGRVDEAWAGTSNDFKSMSGREAFRRYARTHPVLKEPLEYVSCDFLTDSPLKMAECTFRSSSGPAKIKVVLHPEGGQWKVGKLAVE
jgi:hypothetical protein